MRLPGTSAIQHKNAIQGKLGQIYHYGGKHQKRPHQTTYTCTNGSTRSRKLHSSLIAVSNPTEFPYELPNKNPKGHTIQTQTQLHAQNRQHQNSPRLQIEEIDDNSQFTTSEPLITYDHEQYEEFLHQQSLDWKRRWQIHKDTTDRQQLNEIPQWYLESRQNEILQNDSYRRVPFLRPTFMTQISTITRTTIPKTTTERH